MYCGGGHLGFPIGIKNIKFVEDAGHRLTLDPMGKCSNAFLETTNMIKAKLYMNVHWMVLYKLYVFCSDMKFKMVTTAKKHKKQRVCRGPSNDHSWAVWFQLSKWF
jgi:hypothetical protein